MPTNKPNSISSLRGRFDPHYKLSGKVEGLEKGISDQVSQIHKTLSKSFVMQRKTLVRVLGLEKRVNHLELQQAAEEQAKENLDEILSDIREEESEAEAEVGGGTKTKVKPKIRAKKRKIKAKDLKKGTPLDGGFASRVMGRDKEGNYLSKEERIARFKGSKISADKLKPEKSDEQKGGVLAAILTGVNSIVETLKATKKQDKKQQDFLRITEERSRRKKKEGKLEFGIFDGLKKTATKLLAPMKSAWNKMLDFLGKVILGRVLFKILKWMGDKDNHGKLESIIKFFEDWWPAMLAGYLLFGNSLTSMVTGMLAKMAMWLAPMLGAIAKLMLNPWVAAAMVLGVGGVLAHQQIKKNRQEFDEQDDDSTLTVEEFQEDNKGIENPNEKTADIQPSQGYVETGSMPGMMNFNKGGTVPGRGNKDTVPAMLTPGEFVMSKGAVQKYGENTLAGMNAAAGGTNRPTLMRGYNEGGSATSMSQEELVAAVGPSLQMFMEQHNALIDSDPEFYGEYKRIEMDRDGKMPNFGQTIANMGEFAFNQSVEMLQNNEAIEPEAKEALLKKMLWIRKETLENPNFKADLAFDINKDIPGTAANRLFLKAQADTTSIAAKGGISARDRALLMNRRGMSGGGLVQGFQGGGGVGSIKFTGEQLRNTLSVSPKNVANITPRKSATVITPSEKKKVTVAYEEEKNKSAAKTKPNNSQQKIPNFDVTASRSPQKIKVLGISV